MPYTDVFRIFQGVWAAPSDPLYWSQTELAKEAGAVRSTVVDFETGKRKPPANSLTAIRAALETASIDFIPENSGGLGVSELASDIKQEY